MVDVTKCRGDRPDWVSEAVEGLPNNGRNIFNFTTLTPNVAIVQGPDGAEISVGGQRGIHNNVSVDGADFNNPFFGEQRGGQRPAFTFNLDAVQDFVVVADGANAEFGRSSGGFINVITKSGTNAFHGSAHYFGKYDGLSADYSHTFSNGTTSGFVPDFRQHQFGGTFGGPLVRDKAFFFLAYDQQEYNETKQTTRLASINPALVAFTDTAFGGVLSGDFGSVARTNDANALLAKFDFRLSPKHNATLKYNYTRSSQENGTFDVDTWGRSANALENDHSHAVNGSLTSLFSSALSNEFRFQWAREDRPRPYEGPINPATGRPFPDTDIDSLGGYRIGMPFFIPLKTAYDYRLQVLDNISLVRGDHLFKFGVEWNRTGVNQTFLGFANGRMSFNTVQGFLNYVATGPSYVECSDGSNNTNGTCPVGTAIVGPVNLYLQQAGVPPITVEEAGTQTIIQHELAVFLQDSWKPSPKLTLNYGLRWEAQIEPSLITPIPDLFYFPFIGQTVTTPAGTFKFPTDGTIPSDYGMFQPRFGFAYDMKGDGKQVIRANAGLYYARIPGLNLASVRSTDGSRGQTMFTSSFFTDKPFIGLPVPPAYGDLLAPPTGGPFRPEVHVFDANFENPRTFTATIAFEREIARGLAGSISYTHARTDHLTRFFNANDPIFGNGVDIGPWSTGLNGGPNGIGSCSSSRARLSRATTVSRPRFGGRSIRTSSSRSTIRSRSTSRTTTTNATPSPSGTPRRTLCKRSTTGAIATSGTGSMPGCSPCSRETSTSTTGLAPTRPSRSRRFAAPTISPQGSAPVPRRNGSAPTATSSYGTPSARTTRSSLGTSGCLGRSTSARRGPSRRSLRCSTSPTPTTSWIRRQWASTRTSTGPCTAASARRVSSKSAGGISSRRLSAIGYR